MQVYSEYGNTSKQELEETSTVLRIQNLELALEKAIQNIALLQNNLSYVIGVKEELQAELTVREKREQALVRQLEKELARKEKEIDSLKQNQQELGALLQQTKESIEIGEAASRQRDDESRRLERKLEQQKATILAMQEQLAAVRYSSDLSYTNLTQDNIRLQQLESQNDQLKYELQRMKGQLEREANKSRRFQKEALNFKSWLGKVVGVRKVVEGCEVMLMEEISNRLNNCSRP